MMLQKYAAIYPASSEETANKKIQRLHNNRVRMFIRGCGDTTSMMYRRQGCRHQATPAKVKPASSTACSITPSSSTPSTVTKPPSSTALTVAPGAAALIACSTELTQPPQFMPSTLYVFDIVTSPSNYSLTITTSPNNILLMFREGMDSPSHEFVKNLHSSTSATAPATQQQ